MIRIDYPPGLIQDLIGLANITPKQLPATEAALKKISAEAAETWRSWARGRTMPSGDRIMSNTGDYAASIKARRLDQGNAIGYEVYTDSPIHDYLEDGTKSRDMKTMIARSKRARLAAAGHKYLIIPFRHNVANPKPGGGEVSRAGEMKVPLRIQQFFQRGTPSRPIRRFIERQVQGGQGVTRFQNRWGTRLPPQIVGRAPNTALLGQRSKVASKYTWRSGLFDGMVHFAGFKGRHGSYMTFRTMSQNSPANSWIHPGIKPKRILQQLHDRLLSRGVIARITDALTDDMLQAIRGRG